MPSGMCMRIKRLQNYGTPIPWTEHSEIKEPLINSLRADTEKNWVLMTALFCRNTLCIARKSD